MEVGNYDTYPILGDYSGFSGCWGAYPFLPSGLILASDIGNGLFVLEPTYQRAAYLEGIVTEAQSGVPLPNVTIKILSDDPNLDASQASGEYKTGQATAGTFIVEYSKPGYTSKQVEVQLVNGEITLMDVELSKQRLTFVEETVSCEDSIRIQFTPNILDFPNYRWTFIDGVPSNSSSAEPEVIYPKAGTYTVKLEGLDIAGSTISSVEQTIQINSSPNADFEAMTNEKKVTFSNLSDNGESYVWTFGDGTSSEEVAPVHQYDSTGVYTVALMAVNDCGAATVEKTIAVTSTSLEEIGGLATFGIAPNPFQSTTVLTYRFQNLVQNGRLTIYDVLGKVIVEKPIQQKEHQWVIGDSLPKGVYFVQLAVNNLVSKPIKLVKH